MRKIFIAGNWKMHKTIEEAQALARVLITASRAADGKKKIMIAPPFTSLSAVNRVIEGTNLLLGAQNMGPEEKGAHTGEISIGMLTDVGVSVVILGHSERRHVYQEGDELINRKVRLALKHELEIILCVGETLDERESGVTTQVVEAQVKKGLDGISEEQLNKVTIAYEPVWAIGTGKTATPQDADDTHLYIRDLLSRLYSRARADELVIQYGGSVKPHNAGELMRMSNIDGLLVGGASLVAEDFMKIVNYK